MAVVHYHKIESTVQKPQSSIIHQVVHNPPVLICWEETEVVKIRKT